MQYDSRIGRRWELDPKTVTGLSGYACLGDSPIWLSDVEGDEADWIPEVKETKVNGTVVSKQIILNKEAGDDAASLSKFLNVDEKEASQLYSSVSNNELILPNSVSGVTQINEMLKMEVDGNYSEFCFGWLTENFDCYQSSITVSQEKQTIPMGCMDKLEFKREVLNNYDDVADDPSKFKFGHTIMRFGGTTNFTNVTVHAAIFLGVSRNGTTYTWSKNGCCLAPKVMTLSEVLSVYPRSKVEGYRPEPGGGYYNLSGQ